MRYIKVMAVDAVIPPMKMYVPVAVVTKARELDDRRDPYWKKFRLNLSCCCDFPLAQEDLYKDKTGIIEEGSTVALEHISYEIYGEVLAHLREVERAVRYGDDYSALGAIERARAACKLTRSREC